MRLSPAGSPIESQDPPAPASRRLWWLPVASACILSLIIVAMVCRDYPLIGHDYRYYIPHLTDTALHVRLNGWSIQWYSPSFGGGLPAFPNPQHFQYTLVQALTTFVNPWLAINLTTVIMVCAGFWACVTFCRDYLRLCPFHSSLCAIFFCGSGFYVERVTVGHLNHQLFPLTTCLLILLIDTKRRLIVNAAWLGLLVAAIVYSAGFQLILMIAMSLGITLAVAEASGWTRLRLTRVLSAAAIGAAWALAICAVKIHSVLSLMEQFPRELSDVYQVGLGQALAGFAGQFGGVMLLSPLFRIARVDVSEITNGLAHLMFGRPQFGVWEVDMSLSPVLIACLALAAWQLAISWTSWRALNRRQLVAAGVAVLLIWITVEMTLARGIWHTLLQPLPILRSLHVNPRYAAVFLLPLSIVGTVGFARAGILQRWPRVAWLALAIALLSPLCYHLVPGYLQRISFDIRPSLAVDARMRAGETFPVDAIANTTDADAIGKNESSLRPYEPLFGYDLEHWSATVRVGPVTDLRDGKFNLTNPVSLVFPGAIGLGPFERIDASDRQNLEAFRSRRQPDWPLPPTARWLSVLSASAVLAACATLGASAMLRLWQLGMPRREGAPAGSEKKGY